MTPMIIWFCLALIVTIVEMFLVTFYLLAVTLGMCAGGLAAYFDGSLETQLTAAGITTIIAACFSFMLRKKLRRPIDTKLNNLDKGERVKVEPGKINPDGTAKVVYRGADWTAYSTQGALTAGIYLIDKVDGTRLVLEEKVAGAEQVVGASTTSESAQDPAAQDSADKAPAEQDQAQSSSDNPTLATSKTQAAAASGAATDSVGTTADSAAGSTSSAETVNKPQNEVAQKF